MMNKCSNCGFECDEFEVICPRCGMKIEMYEIPDEVSQEKSIEEDLLEQIEKEEAENTNQPVPTFSAKDFKQMEFFDSSPSKKIFQKPIFIHSIFIIFACCAFTLVSHHFVASQTTRQAALKFSHYSSNPSKIPQFKEPKTYKELKENIQEVENFMKGYLRFATSDANAKEQIIASYLNEIDKLPHISTATMQDTDIKECSSVNNIASVKKCAHALEEFFEGTSVNVFYDYDGVYLYPNSLYIKNNFSKFLSPEFKTYLTLRAKYNYPTSLGVNLSIKPKKLVDKITDLEKLLKTAKNEYLQERIEEIIYHDFKKLIFSPSIYATTTKEMTNDFKKAYNYLITSKRNSALRPLIMSYVDKKRSYSEENFKIDYPYRRFKSTFEKNAENAIFKDIFISLRENAVDENSDVQFKYVYNTANSTYKRYSSNLELDENNLLIGDADLSNNISIYSHTYSPMQELNILKYGKLYLINDGLYVYNSDKLSLSKIVHNGKVFVRRDMNVDEISELFPGVKVLNIDNYQYNILVEKNKPSAKYMIVSMHNQGWHDYEFSTLYGKYNTMLLPNMFNINSLEDVVVSFHGSSVNPDETSESQPTFKFVFHTVGQPNYNDSVGFAQFDKQTAGQTDEELEQHEANIMPKIDNDNDGIEDTEEDMQNPPEQEIEPPIDE